MLPTTSSLAERGRLELLYYISRELNRRLDLRELIERILQLTSQNVGAENGSLILVDEAGNVYNAALLINGALVPNTTDQLKKQITGGLAGVALRERQVALVNDTTNDERWQSGNLAEGNAAKSALAAPLLFGDRTLGVITLVNSKPDQFDHNDKSLIKAIAELGAVAVENARLLQESRNQANAMSNLVEAAQALSSTLESDRILKLLLAQTVKLLHLEAASIALIDNQTNELVFQMSSGGSGDQLIGLRLKVGQGVAGWVAQSGESVLVPEVAKDQRFFGNVDKQTGFTTRSLVCAPIKFESYTIGIIEGVNLAPEFIDQHTLTLLTGVAGLAGNAIAHAQQLSFTQSVKDRYAGLFEDSLDPIIITDLQGIVTDANHKAGVTFGYMRSEMIGMHIKKIHQLGDAQKIQGTGPLGGTRLNDLARGIQQRFETRVITKDEREIPVEVHAKRISTPDYDFIQWIERDISEREQMEEMREDLMSMIFHDLRAPLGNIMSSLTLLQSSLPHDDELNVSVVGIATRSGQHLSRLVDSLLDLRRFEAGQGVLTKKESSLLRLIAEAVEQVHPIAQGKNITLTFKLPPKQASLDIDEDMIRRVLINLIENSVKYTPNEGAVFVTTYDEDGKVIVSIQDNGPGIPEAERSRVFEKFARVRRDGGPKGLGLGLAFVKMAIEAHGGKVWAESVQPHGAIFKFALPAKK